MWRGKSDPHAVWGLVLQDPPGGYHKISMFSYTGTVGVGFSAVAACMLYVTEQRL